MSWKKAMIVERAIAKRLEEKPLGVGRVFTDGDKPHCLIGVALDALGITAKDCDIFLGQEYPKASVSGVTMRDIAKILGCPSEEFEKQLWEAIAFNDGIGITHNKITHKQDQPHAAEILVSAIKEFVPDDDE